MNKINIKETNIQKFIPISNDNKHKSQPFNQIALNEFLHTNKELLEFERIKPGYYRDMVNRGLVNYAEENFTKWIDKQKKTFVYFKRCKELPIEERLTSSELNELINGEPVITSKPYVDSILGQIENRFSNGRINKVKKRMRWLAYENRKSQAVLLTLTIDPKLFDYDFIKISKVANKELNRFMTNLKAHFKKQNRKFPKYIKSSEFMVGRPENNYVAKGLIHFHICFFNATRLLDWREIKDIWKLGRIYINRTKEGKKIRKPIDYITKYITKTIDLKNEKMILTQAMNWLFGIRNYSNSRGLIYPLYYKKENPEFEIKGGVLFKNQNTTIEDFKILTNHIENCTI